MIAAIAVVVGVLGLSSANLLNSWIYWSLGLLASLVGVILLALYCIRSWKDLSSRTLIVIFASQILIGFSWFAGLQAYQGLSCQNATAEIEKARDLQQSNQEERAYDEYGLTLSSCEAGRAYLYRGEIDTDYGRLPLALDDANHAAALLRPDQVDQRQAAYLRIGKLDASFGNCDAAVVALETGISVNSNFDPLYHNLALVRAAQGLLTSSAYPGRSYPGALDDIQIALSKNPAQTEYLLTRAKIFWTLNDFDDATKDLRRIEQIGPKPGDDGSPAVAASIIGKVEKHTPVPIDTFDHNCH